MYNLWFLSILWIIFDLDLVCSTFLVVIKVVMIAFILLSYFASLFIRVIFHLSLNFTWL